MSCHSHRSKDVGHLNTVEVRHCSNPWMLTGLCPQVLANLSALARLSIVWVTSLPSG